MGSGRSVSVVLRCRAGSEEPLYVLDISIDPDGQIHLPDMAKMVAEVPFK
jgi:hypothetical protein